MPDLTPRRGRVRWVPAGWRLISDTEFYEVIAAVTSGVLAERHRDPEVLDLLDELTAGVRVLRTAARLAVLLIILIGCINARRRRRDIRMLGRALADLSRVAPPADEAVTALKAALAADAGVTP